MNRKQQIEQLKQDLASAQSELETLLKIESKVGHLEDKYQDTYARLCEIFDGKGVFTQAEANKYFILSQGAMSVHINELLAEGLLTKYKLHGADRTRFVYLIN